MCESTSRHSLKGEGVSKRHEASLTCLDLAGQHAELGHFRLVPQVDWLGAVSPALRTQGDELLCSVLLVPPLCDLGFYV